MAKGLKKQQGQTTTAGGGTAKLNARQRDLLLAISDEHLYDPLEWQPYWLPGTTQADFDVLTAAGLIEPVSAYSITESGEARAESISTRQRRKNAQEAQATAPQDDPPAPEQRDRDSAALVEQLQGMGSLSETEHRCIWAALTALEGLRAKQEAV